MPWFTELPAEERRARWQTIAERALRDHVGLAEGDRVVWRTDAHNVVFDVWLRDEHFILRLHPPGTVKAGWLDAETALLTFVSQQMPRRAPHPYRTLHIKADDADDPIVGLLLRYVTGEVITAEDLNIDRMARIGHFIADLHRHLRAYTYHADAIPQRPRLDYDGLFGENGLYDPGAGGSVFTAEQHAIMNATAQRVAEAMRTLGENQQTFGLIHGDLLLKNLLFHEGEVRALDFEYCGYGYTIYDLAPLLWQLKTQPHYALLEETLWQHYIERNAHLTAYRVLLEPFIAGRQVASMRWLAQNHENPAIKPHVTRLINQRTQELADYLKTGQLKRHSRTL